MNLKSTSKYISLIMRHKPEAAGITLDEHGWADVEELIAGVSKTHILTMDILEEIVDTDEKQRYSFNEDKTLYHGTGQKSVESIDRQGLLPQGRLYVHLSGDIETAIKVGRRHGKPVVYEVLSGDMENDGYLYYRSVNGVWLTKTVPVKYLRKKEDL